MRHSLFHHDDLRRVLSSGNYELDERLHPTITKAGMRKSKKWVGVGDYVIARHVQHEGLGVKQLHYSSPTERILEWKSRISAKLKEVFEKPVINPDNLNPRTNYTVVVHTKSGLFVNPHFFAVPDFKVVNPAEGDWLETEGREQYLLRKSIANLTKKEEAIYFKK